MRVRPVTNADIPQIAVAWNSVLVHDQVSSDRSRSAILGDPNYEPEDVLLAEGDRGAEYVEAGWANSPFCASQGWGIVRRYAVLRKEL